MLPPHGLHIRPATELDLPRMVEIHNAAAAADNTGQVESVADLRHALAHHAPVPTGQGLAIAEVDGLDVGFHRLRAFSEPAGLRIYSHRGFVHPDWREQGIGGGLVDEAERRLSALAAEELAHEEAVLSSWCYDTERGAVGHLVSRGYAVQRQMLEMARSIAGELPKAELPPGLQIRPVEAEHLRHIREAYLEASADDEGAVADSPWAYAHWIALPQWDFDLWKIAWDGDKIIGMVLNYISGSDTAPSLRRAHTEDVTVLRAWRRQGVASALLRSSASMFSQLGFSQAYLDVNAYNTSGAVATYASLGYRRSSSMAVYRRRLIMAS